MNKTRLLSLFVFSVIIYSHCPAQQVTPERLGFISYTIADKEMGEINFYVSKNKIEEEKPVLLYLDGSGAMPLFQYTSRGVGSSVAIDFKNLSNDYHIVLISKPGIPFIDSVQFDPAHGMMPTYKSTSLYNQKLSLEWRTQSATLVLNKIQKELKVNRKKIAVLGISEGFQVGAKLAATEKSITHLLLYVGNGLTQFYDFIIQNRTDAQRGLISEPQAQKNIDSLYAVVKAIYANPGSTDRQWLGHTYLRWSSFCKNNPSENILSLTIPVYIVASSNDRNTSVLGTDYLYLESIQRGKQNIVYKVYPYDHSFNEAVKNEQGKTIGMKSHMQEVIKEGLSWLNTK